MGLFFFALLSHQMLLWSNQWPPRYSCGQPKCLPQVPLWSATVTAGYQVSLWGARWPCFQPLCPNAFFCRPMTYGQPQVLTKCLFGLTQGHMSTSTSVAMLRAKMNPHTGQRLRCSYVILAPAHERVSAPHCNGRLNHGFIMVLHQIF